MIFLENPGPQLGHSILDPLDNDGDGIVDVEVLDTWDDSGARPSWRPETKPARPSSTGSIDATLAAQTSEANDAWSYLRTRWRSFLELAPRLEQLRRDAARAVTVARDRGDTEAEQLARQALDDAIQLESDYGHLRGQLESWNMIGSGLGVIPVFPAALGAAAIVAAAGAMAFIWTRFGATRRIVDGIVSGSIDADEGREILEELRRGGPGSFLEGATGLLVAGALILFLFRS